VITGLATDGVVEVRAVEGRLAKGDRVVVGQADIGVVAPDGEEDADEGTDEDTDRESEEASAESTPAG
jgi:hypothetical protein